MWKVERSQRCYLHFEELAPSAGNEKNAHLVEAIRICTFGFRDSENFEVELTTDSHNLFVDVLRRETNEHQADSNPQSVLRPGTRSELRLGLISGGEVLNSEGDHRLCLFDTANGFGQEFHSLRWDCAVMGGWHSKLRITKKQFQGRHAYRRWVSQLHSFTPATGVAVIRVAEGDRPLLEIASCQFNIPGGLGIS